MSDKILKLSQAQTLYQDLRERSAPVITKSAIGNPIVFSDGADGLPLSKCELTLLPRQSGSGDASPENVRPLIPWENVGIWTSGANTWNEQWEVGTISIETGENVVANDRIRTEDYNPCIPNKACYIVDPTHGKNIRLFYYDKNKTFIDASSWSEGEITTPSNAYFFRFIVAASYGTEYKNDIAINYPSNVTTYAPATPHPVDLSSITPPVYGAFVVFTREGVQVWGTHGYLKLNTADMNNSESYPGWRQSGVAQFVGTGVNKLYYGQTMNIGKTFGANTNTNDILLLPVDTYGKTQAEWQALAIDVEVVVPLPTPVLLATLSPQEIETLLGTNTIWSDADSIDIEYRADTGLFVNQNSVKDVQINGTSATVDGVVNIPLMTTQANGFGVAKANMGFGTSMSSDGSLVIVGATDQNIKVGTDNYRPIVPNSQHKSVFYALAKLAGADMASSSNAIGTYTDAAKQAIQKMLGFDNILGNYESSTTASKAYTVGETFIFNGKRYRATANIAQGYVITPGTNCELVPLDGQYVRKTDYAGYTEPFEPGLIRVNWASGCGLEMMSDGHLRIVHANPNVMKAGANTFLPITPYDQHTSVYYALAKLAGADMASLTGETVGVYPQAQKDAILAMLGAVGKNDIAGSTGETKGIAFFNSNYGVGINSETGGVYLSRPSDDIIKAGANDYKPIVPSIQHKAIYYGLSKLAGVDLASSGSDAIGTYPTNAKIAIRSLIGAAPADVIAVQDTQPTNTDTKVWITETPAESVEVPTYAEFQALDAAVVKKTDYATQDTAGAVKVNTYGAYGIRISTEINGDLRIMKADSTDIKSGTPQYRPIVPYLQHESVFYGLAKAAGDTTQSSSSNAVGTYTTEAKTAIQTMLGVPGDIQVNGTSVVSNGVANITKAIDNSSNLGVVGTETSFGIRVNDSGKLYTYTAGDNELRLGTQGYKPIVPANQHKSIFFGLAKAANADMASLSDVTVGQYPQAQKTAIQSMLGIEASVPLIEEVSGTTPTIVGMPNVRYICGEVTLLTITPPAAGSIVVRFSTGSSTTLTVPNTVKWPAWFDATSLDADTTYEIIITDGVYGGVMSWA